MGTEGAFPAGAAAPLLLLAALGLGLLMARALVRLQRAGRVRAAARAGYFAACAGVLAAPQTRLAPTGFARVSGRWQGARVDLQAIPDALTFRKLPALWVMVSVLEPQPVAGETRIMARPGGQEPFSTFPGLPAEIRLPPEFPAHCALRCTAPGDLPPLAVLRALAPLFADPAVKEVVVSARGLRLVLLAEEAARTPYLLFREAELGRAPLPARRLVAALEALTAIGDSLNARAA